MYWYKNENGNVSHGVVYFYDSLGHVHKLTISAWQLDFPSAAKVVYDLLNIAPPYPLYDLDKIVQHSAARYAIIFPSEATVDYIRTDHAWIPKIFPVTTSASIDGADWTKLNGMTPVIFSEATAWGCHEAFRLHATLEKQGLKTLYIKRQKDEGCGSIPFIQDLGMLAIPHSACSFPEFAVHCQQVFGVEPPAGVLPKTVPLADLPEPAVAPEVLMDGLLDTSEQMTIHAWRGIGKSLSAMLLALCFASGKSALNGRVCPSRKYRVLLLDGEMSTRILKRRARRLCNGHGMPIETIKELKIRSNRNEKKALELETDAGLKELKPDMKAAEIIVVDSVFKFFPSAMKPDFDATKMMQRFLDWARENEKTLIVIDHEGKGGATSYGSMGKAISSDVVLRLCHAKSPHVIEAHVQKVHDHAETTGAYLKMRVEADNERITCEVCGDHKAVAALEAESSGTAGKGEPTESSAERAKSLEEAIMRYVSEHPDTPKGRWQTPSLKWDMGAAPPSKRGSRSCPRRASSQAGRIGPNRTK